MNENPLAPVGDMLLQAGALAIASYAATTLAEALAYPWESNATAWLNFLEACKPLGDPDDVRFVFGFDS